MKKYLAIIIALLIICVSITYASADSYPPDVQSRIDFCISNDYHYALYHFYIEGVIDVYNIVVNLNYTGESLKYDAINRIYLAGTGNVTRYDYDSGSGYSELLQGESEVWPMNKDFFLQTNYDVYQLGNLIHEGVSQVQEPIELPHGPLDPEQKYVYNHDIIFKMNGKHYLAMTTSNWYSDLEGVEGEGSYIYTTQYDYEEAGYRNVYMFELQDNEWVLYDTFTNGDSHNGSQFGLVVFTSDETVYNNGHADYLIDEIIRTDKDIYDNNHLGEKVLVYPAYIGAGSSEYYIDFIKPKNGYTHSHSVLEVELQFKYPRLPEGNIYPTISGIPSYQVIEKDYVYDENSSIIEGYMIFQFTPLKGYTDITATYLHFEGEEYSTIRTLYYTSFQDTNGDGLDDATGLTREELELTINPSQYTNKFKEKLNLNVLNDTMNKFRNMDTSKGEAPVITINLHGLYDASVGLLSPDMINSNPFSEEPYVLFDWGILEDYSFMGYTVIDYFRMLEGAFMILYTFFYVRRKVFPDKVVA